ncbi:MAG TPA: UDP-N-acetylmuramate--L-alanine ligase, partial [Acidobacteriota bacterium]|nr:UDP-N-acetylmuramate--L-alanine ligase [Acidobacteriota bacterium]
MLEQKPHVHFVGAGGIGMSALALLLTQLGHTVSGSDLKASGQTRKLQEAGAQIFIGPHRLQNLQNAGLVVVSSAIAPDNPEVLEAKRKRIPVIHRSDLLAELMQGKKGIAIAGSHGKTTTTAMIAMLLIDTGFDPTCLVGGVVMQLARNARLGQSQYLIAETDESDRSFLKLQPEMVVMTNIDLEHMVSYRSEADLIAAFEQFAKKVDPSRCVLCKEDPRVRQILPGLGGSPITYGFQQHAQLVSEGIVHRFGSSSFRVLREGRFWGQIQLNVSGIHNVLNSLAVIGISILLGIPSDKTILSLARFRGVARRLEKKGSAGGVDFYDDYGHHPTEIRATLAATRESGRRVIVIFQPHRYTRIRDSFEGFTRCFEDADLLFVLDIYSAGEPRLEGISSERLAQEITRAGHPAARFVAGHAVIGEVCNILRQGDLVLTIGAGDV